MKRSTPEALQNQITHAICRFIKTNGKEPRPKSRNKEEACLGQWLEYLRRLKAGVPTKQPPLPNLKSKIYNAKRLDSQNVDQTQTFLVEIPPGITLKRLNESQARLLQEILDQHERNNYLGQLDASKPDTSEFEQGSWSLQETKVDHRNTCGTLRLTDDQWQQILNGEEDA